MEQITNRKELMAEMLEALKPWFGEYLCADDDIIRLATTDFIVANLSIFGQWNIDHDEWTRFTSFGVTDVFADKEERDHKIIISGIAKKDL